MKKREDSFFGIHFDFHAQRGQTVGADYRPEVVEEMLDRVKPDYVQCDTKGHYGYSSYPTKIGTPPTGLAHDVLKMWRELTKQRGIALYAHHSGLFDMAAAQAHPDWAIVDSAGKVSTEFLSPFGPYADAYLIPQLKELALEYDLDGAWIDGECWGAFLDYSDHAVNAYKQEYHTEPPRPGDGDFERYKDFCRKGFETYVAHYIGELKKAKPGFAVTSNWMYSSLMPDRQWVELDFLSGDLAPDNAVESARHEARCLAARNRPWDLMAWGHHAIPASYEAVNRSTKEYEQTCQEAAMVIALGGGFQFFNIMYGLGGMVQPWAIPLWARVADFCRQREFCHKAKPVHQVGVVYPMERVAKTETLYTRHLDAFRNTCSWNNALLESGFSTEVIFQTELEDLQNFPLVVLPKAPMLGSDAKAFQTYVENGGHLVVDLGSAPCFADFAGVAVASKEQQLFFVAGGDAVAAAEGTLARFTGDFAVTGTAYPDNFFDDSPIPLSICKRIGKGSITFMALDFAEIYKHNGSTAIRTFLKNAVYATGFRPLVEISGSSYADLVLTQKDGKLLINIVNTAGPGGLARVRSYNEVPKIGPLTVRVYEESVKRITAVPGGKELPFRQEKGYCEFTLDTVHIHTAAVITLR